MLIIFDGPHGVGKDTIINTLLQLDAFKTPIIPYRPVSTIWNRRENNDWRQKDKAVYWYFKGEVFSRLAAYKAASQQFPHIGLVNRELASEAVYSALLRGYEFDWMDEYRVCVEKERIQTLFVYICPNYVAWQQRLEHRKEKLSEDLTSQTVYTAFNNFFERYPLPKIRIRGAEDYATLHLTILKHLIGETK